MMSVLSKNDNIWPNYGLNKVRMPIFEYSCFDHNNAIFWLIGLKFFIGAQETIFFLLVMTNPSYDAYFPFSFF